MVQMKVTILVIEIVQFVTSQYPKGVAEEQVTRLTTAIVTWALPY